MSERATREVKITGEHTLVLHDYITGRDKREIEGVFLKDDSMRRSANASDLKNKDAGSVEMVGMKGTTQFEAENKALELVVKEIKTSDGAIITDRKQVVDFILDLPVEAYEEVIKAVNEITEPKKAETT